MAVEFDHLFICTDMGAPAADRLITLGLAEGSRNVHPGQGTANRRFFFRNAMLELVWVQDPQAAQSAPIQPIRIWERWVATTQAKKKSDDMTCPFGFCIRSTELEAPFPSWPYHPPYLPPSLSYPVGSNSESLTEPMLFQNPMGQRPDSFPANRAQPLHHPIGFCEITRVELMSPITTDPSDALKGILKTNLVQVCSGSVHVVTLGFDHEQNDQQINFLPELPLILSW